MPITPLPKQPTRAPNIATRGAGFLEVSLEAEEGFVLSPDQPGEGGEPEPDDGRVGGEDPTVILRGVAGGYHGYALVVREAGEPQALLGSVVEDHGAHGLELPPPGPLPGVL